MNDGADGAVIVIVSGQALAGGINGRNRRSRVVDCKNFRGVPGAGCAGIEMQVAERQDELKRQREQRDV